MPDDYCQYVQRCTGCGGNFRAQKGDCCVYCSYGSVPCPSKQREANQVV